MNEFNDEEIYYKLIIKIIKIKFESFNLFL